MIEIILAINFFLIINLPSLIFLVKKSCITRCYFINSIILINLFLSHFVIFNFPSKDLKRSSAVREIDSIFLWLKNI